MDIPNSLPGASVWDTLLFSYTTKVVHLGNTAQSLDIGDLPVVPGDMRATYLFRSMRSALSTIRLDRFIFWDIRPGSGWELAYRLAYVNRVAFATQITLATIGAVLYYGPPLFLQKLVKYLETDPERRDRSWGWFYAFGMFATTAVLHIREPSSLLPAFCDSKSLVLVNGQMWSLSTTTLQVSMRVQLNSILFAKTLARKDVASSSGPSENKNADRNDTDASSEDSEKEDGEFSSKAQIMTLMTTDVDRVSEFCWHTFTLVGTSCVLAIPVAAALTCHQRLPDRDHNWHNLFVQLTGLIRIYRTCCDLLVPSFESFCRQGRRRCPRESYEGEG
jgi:hypothetical protein